MIESGAGAARALPRAAAARSAAAVRWRTAVIVAGIALLALFAFLYRDDRSLYVALLTAWGEVPFRFAFLDTHAVLSALQCAGQGLDTYQVNPCDVLTRAFTYSPLILEVARLGPVSVGWNDATGLILAIAFILAVASLPAPRQAMDRVVVALALISTMTVFAVERGNIDLVIFLLMIGAGHLLAGRPRARTAAYSLILFGALLKYYPLAAFVTALRERPRRLAAIALLTVAVLAVFLAYYWHALGEAMTRVPDGSYYTDLFGAVNLPFGLAHLLSPLDDSFPAARPFLRILPWGLLVLLFASCVVQARRGFAAAEDGLRALGDAERIFLGLGAVLIVGCFFAGQSIGYRGIFFLMLLPGLLAMARDAGDRRFLATALMILFLMWGEMFRQVLQHLALGDARAMTVLASVRVVFWMARELVWWRVIATLLGLVLCLAARSESVTAMLPWLRPPRQAPQ